MTERSKYRFELTGMYPSKQQWVLRDEERQNFHLGLIEKRFGGEAVHIIDIGGHVGPFGPWAAMHGHKVTVLDDFADYKKTDTHGTAAKDEYANILRSVHSALGVETVTHDLCSGRLPFEDGAFDALTCFQVIEHLHGGVRELMHECVRVLRPGGLFVLSAPNAANLKKRVSVLFGMNNFSRFPDWYEAKVFRGHVREQVVRDLRTIAEDLQLKDATFFGKNWMATKSASIPRRFAGRLIAPLAIVRPQLASNIYVYGKTGSSQRVSKDHSTGTQATVG